VSVAGFFILLAMAILLRLTGNKLIPVIMPTGRLKTTASGWAGGFVGSWGKPTGSGCRLHPFYCLAWYLSLR